MLPLALQPRLTLWGLTELKMEILVQVAPLFVLGVRAVPLPAGAALAGLAVGSALAAGLTLAGFGRIAGVHAGLLGLAANTALVLGLSRIGRTGPTPARAAPQ